MEESELKKLGKIGNVNVTLSCISPEARELLDAIMEAWDTHYAHHQEFHKGKHTPDYYGFAYWLVRWSGLIQPAGQESEWQPIDSAPKDGTWIIVVGGIIAYWRAKDNAWFTITAEEWPGKPIQWDVTHWMPLPQPANPGDECA